MNDYGMNHHEELEGCVLDGRMALLDGQRALTDDGPINVQS